MFFFFGGCSNSALVFGSPLVVSFLGYLLTRPWFAMSLFLFVLRVHARFLAPGQNWILNDIYCRQYAPNFRLRICWFFFRSKCIAQEYSNHGSFSPFIFSKYSRKFYILLAAECIRVYKRLGSTKYCVPLCGAEFSGVKKKPAKTLFVIVVVFEALCMNWEGGGSLHLT